MFISWGDAPPLSDNYRNIVADGPWEARFVFCGLMGVSPDMVTVIPSIRMKNFPYFCEVKLPPKVSRLDISWAESVPHENATR